MVRTRVGALALAALPSALAFRDTSPFFLFSTAELLIPNNQASILASSTVTSDVLAALESCPTRSYLIVEQDGVSSFDYQDGRSAPQLGQYVEGRRKEVRSSVAIPDVIGQIDVDAIAAHLQAKCAPAHDDKSQATWFNRVQLQAPAASKALRTSQLQTNDAKLEEQIINEAKSQDYTVIYITTPQSSLPADLLLEQEQYSYDMGNQFGDGIQMELKRDLSSHARRADDEQGGLFERYQYFTPGIFMGFVGIAPLFLLLVVAIRAVTSLEVSYFAFSKEMGPAAQKKQ